MGITRLFSDLAVSEVNTLLQNERCLNVFEATIVQNLLSHAGQLFLTSLLNIFS